jgi:hypothetical protein
MVLTDFLQQLLIQTPTIAILLVIMFVDRRDHAKAMEALREDNQTLHATLIDRIDLIIALEKRGE